LPDQENISPVVNGNHGDAGFMVDPALPVDTSVGETVFPFIDRENPALINLLFPDIVI
jgi:hypothetical protein